MAKHTPKKDPDPEVEIIKDRIKEVTGRNTSEERRRRQSCPEGEALGMNTRG